MSPNPLEMQAIVNGTVLTMDDCWTSYDCGMVVVAGTTIREVGPFDQVRLDRLGIPKEHIIDADGGIIIPGFVNTHTHIGMSLFRGIADDTANRLKRVIFPLERKFTTAEVVYAASLHSLTEMILGGTTCFADMYYFATQTAQAVQESGIRGIIGQSVATYGGPDAPDFFTSIELVHRLDNLLKGNDRVMAAIAPHAPYSLTKQELLRCAEIHSDRDIRILSHLAEMPFEESYTAEHYHMRPIPFYHQCNLLGSRTTMAHCIFADGNDQRLLVETGTGIAHNPSANSKSGKGIAPAYDLITKGARLGLGTDGPMSGNTMDMVHILDITAKFQKVLKKDPTIMTPREVLRAATRGGAEALHLEKSIGTLERGKQADIVIVGTDSPAMFPLYDPYAAIVYAASPSDIAMTMVDGKLLMYRRKLHTLDPQAIRIRAADMVSHIRHDMHELLQ